MAGRIRRIPIRAFHGHSIGHWEKDTLVVDTVAVLPQAYLAVNEAVGVPNNGDMHIVERLHLLDRRHAWRTIWKLPRTSSCQSPGAPRANITGSARQKYDIVEGVCAQGSFTEAVDKHGNAIFAPVKFHNGVPVGSDSK